MPSTTNSGSSPDLYVDPARRLWRRYLRAKASWKNRWEQHHRTKSGTLILNTPPIPIHPDSEIEIHSLTCERDFTDLLWCLKTFAYFSGRRFNVVIHDDGSLSDPALEHLRSHLPGVTLISTQQANERMRDVLHRFPACLKFRQKLPLARKVLDSSAFATREQFMILDSDVLFFDTPGVMLRAMDGHRLFFMSDYQDGYVCPRAQLEARYGVELFPAVNTGICGVTKAIYDYDWMEQYCADLDQAGLLSHAWAEQTLIAILLSKHRDRVDTLPGGYRLSRTPIDSHTVSHHFVNDGSRGCFYTRGVRHLLKTGFLHRYTKQFGQRT